MKSTYKDPDTLVHYLFVSNTNTFTEANYTLEEWESSIKIFMTDLLLNN